MKRKYKGVIVLKMQGHEESLEDSLKTVTKELEDNGAQMNQIDRIGRKVFAHENHAKQRAGYFAEVHFEAEPKHVNEMKAQIGLKLKDQVMLQYYSRV